MSLIFKLIMALKDDCSCSFQRLPEVHLNLKVSQLLEYFSVCMRILGTYSHSNFILVDLICAAFCWFSLHRPFPGYVPTKH